MMRYILYLLVAANLAFLGWNLLQEHDRISVAANLPPLPATVKRLVTLQESRQQSAATGDPEKGKNESPQAAVAAPATPDGQAAVTEGQPVTSEVVAQPGANAGAGTSIDKLTAAEPPSAGAPDETRCQALGPFAREQDAQTVAQRLDKQGIQSRQRVADMREENGYWVYLPSMSRDAAQEITRKLDAMGDKEYFVGKDNYISLGTFQDIARAEVRLREARDLGFGAVLQVRYQSRQEWWLEFPDSSRARQAVVAIREGQPQLQTHSLACL